MKNNKQMKTLNMELLKAQSNMQKKKKENKISNVSSPSILYFSGFIIFYRLPSLMLSISRTIDHKIHINFPFFQNSSHLSGG